MNIYRKRLSTGKRDIEVLAIIKAYSTSEKLIITTTTIKIIDNRKIKAIILIVVPKLKIISNNRIHML